ncbi:hypothetical protein ACOSQ4_012515 [Xanthoceras sorbifolium]
MASRAAEIVLGCVFNGSLSLHDLNIERRPYHKNCSCALHDLKGVCSNTCSKKNNLSFHKKQAWRSENQYSLSLSSSKVSSQSSFLLNDSSIRIHREVADQVLSMDDGNSLLNP